VRDRAEPSVTHQLLIEPSAPFRLDLTVWALRRRSHNAIDRWDASGAYRRVVLVDGRPVSMSVTQDGGAMAPRLSVVLSRGPST
jgi:DNA-3-methyladenine glycosylase II